MAQAAPRHILDLDVERSLGRGLLGEVYLCRAEDGAMRVVKTVDPKRGRRLRSASRFTREIDDEHLTQYRSVDFDDTHGHLVVMDYFEVKPLSREALRTTLSRELVAMLAKLAESLHRVHEKGILHGSIKPSNVLLRRARAGVLTPLLNDFGFGYVFSAKEPFPGLIEDGLAYAAPERIVRLRAHPEDEEEQERGLGAPSDLYALACVLVEGLTGRRPFGGHASVETLLRAKERPRFDLLQVTSPVRQLDRAKLVSLVERTLSPLPEARPKDARSFAEELRAVIAAPPEHAALLQKVGIA